MSQLKLNPNAAPFHANKIPPPLHPFFFYYRRETRIFASFSKVQKSSPKSTTKPKSKFVPTQPKTPTPQNRVISVWIPKNGFSGNPTGGNGGGGGGRTSVMIKNIPNQFRRYMLIEFLDKLCEEFHLAYDFLYLPMDFVSGLSLGYAFVNFTSARAANIIMELLRGFKWSCYQTEGGNKGISRSRKICDVYFARLQGKNALVLHFKNSKFSCSNKEWLPVVFAPARNGSNARAKQSTIGKYLIN